ncbi:unnamed protein product [Pleuronectes platessa]|uniref:Adenylate cyclase N-terminal domain-containing protein n=1 Tax=Pleuronectes platessa TaxID=8262 RepID=A0A9N7VC38_PLEPL|nr:unnamed protein product [Pleuronectes platessa]
MRTRGRRSPLTAELTHTREGGRPHTDTTDRHESHTGDMELSEVRCSSASEEMYTVNRTPSIGSGGSARPKRLLWQNAVRHITEQRFIHEQGGGGVKGGGADEPYDPGQGARKQSAGDRHNNGGTKVFPERASSDLGFLQIDCAPSNSDFFLNWGYTYRGVIFPTLRNAFKSRDLERLYQRYFLGQRRKSVVVMNLLDVVTKLTLLVLHLTLASARMDPIKGTLLGFFTGIEVVICALVVVRKDTTSHGYLQYSGVVTWVAMATQILAAGLGYGLLGDGVGYVLFTLFATYSMLPLPLTWAIMAGLFTSGLHILVQMLISHNAPLFTNQVGAHLSSSSRRAEAPSLLSFPSAFIHPALILPSSPPPLPSPPHPLPSSPHPLPSPHPIPSSPHLFSSSSTFFFSSSSPFFSSSFLFFSSPLPSSPHPLSSSPHHLPSSPHPLSLLLTISLLLLINSLLLLSSPHPIPSSSPHLLSSSPVLHSSSCLFSLFFFSSHGSSSLHPPPPLFLLLLLLSRSLLLRSEEMLLLESGFLSVTFEQQVTVCFHLN